MIQIIIIDIITCRKSTHVFAVMQFCIQYLSQSLANDYAHESAGFPTWHRLYLLMLEREIQLAVDDPTFSLSYWDWTNFEGQSDWIDLIFNDQKLGGYTENGAVTGDYYGPEQWQTVCWFKDPNNGSTCDPEDTRGIYPLIRCPINPSCTAAEGLFPKEQDASRALYNYNVWRDTSGDEPYAVFNKYAKRSFGNALEGFDANPDDDIYPFDPRLTTVTIANINLTRYLHNTVSLMYHIRYNNYNTYNYCIFIFCIGTHYCWYRRFHH